MLKLASEPSHRRLSFIMVCKKCETVCSFVLCCGQSLIISIETVQGCRPRPFYLELKEHQRGLPQSGREQTACPPGHIEVAFPGGSFCIYLYFAHLYAALSEQMQGLQAASDTEQGQILPRSVVAMCLAAATHAILGCAYKKGACSICGKQVLDTTGYVMSSK